MQPNCYCLFWIIRIQNLNWTSQTLPVDANTQIIRSWGSTDPVTGAIIFWSHFRTPPLRGRDCNLNSNTFFLYRTPGSRSPRGRRMVPPGAPGPPGGPNINGPIAGLSTPSGQIVRHNVHQKVGCNDICNVITTNVTSASSL